MPTSTLANIKVTYTQAGTYTIVHKVSSKNLVTEKVIEQVIKPEPVVEPSIYPATVSTLTPVTKQKIALQPLNIPFIDSSMGYPMKWTKISSNIAANYPKEQSWSKDGTYFKLGRRGLHDPSKNYVKIKSLATPSGATQWRNTVDHEVYVFGGGCIKIHNVITNKTTSTVIDFRGTYGPDVLVSLGAYEGKTDNIDKYCVITLSNTVTAMPITHAVVNLITGTIESTRTNAALGHTFNWMSISQSGNYIFGQIDGSPADEKVYNRADWSLQTTISVSGDHKDTGYNTLGEEVVTMMNYAKFVNLGTGAITNVMTEADATAIWGYNRSGGHSTCANKDLSGWACFCVQTLTALNGEIFMAKLNTTGAKEFRRFGLSRRTKAGYDYETHASPNRNGTKITLTSDFDGQGGYDCYIIEMP